MSCRGLVRRLAFHSKCPLPRSGGGGGKLLLAGGGGSQTKNQRRQDCRQPPPQSGSAGQLPQGGAHAKESYPLPRLSHWLEGEPQGGTDTPKAPSVLSHEVGEVAASFCLPAEGAPRRRINEGPMLPLSPPPYPLLRSGSLPPKGCPVAVLCDTSSLHRVLSQRKLGEVAASFCLPAEGAPRQRTNEGKTAVGVPLPVASQRVPSPQGGTDAPATDY
jgi:hypothetical protein